MDAREQLIREIEREADGVGGSTGHRRISARVLDAMRAVPREEFVPADLASHAHDNRPLPIGHGQTISQPFIVAIMTDCLEPAPHHRVLEVGTGCGYQTAVLAELVDEVYSIETIRELGDAAAERLDRLGYGNIHLRIGNGRAGWPEAAPFDGILVTAAARDVPPALVQQLAPGGRMIIPVGAGWGQQLCLVTRDEEGGISSRKLLGVAFVPLTGED